MSILGGQDGLVNMLGIILGVIAGGGSNAVLLAAGFAAAITESISMGAVAYTSTVSERDYYRAEEARESNQDRTGCPTPSGRRGGASALPRASREAARGGVVDTITANREGPGWQR